MRRDSVLITRLKSTEIRTLDEQHQPTPFHCAGRGSYFSTQLSDAARDSFVAETPTAGKPKALVSAERMLKLYMKAEKSAEGAIEMWMQLRVLSTEFVAGIKAYGDRLKKDLAKRRKGLLLGFADKAIGEKVANILEGIDGLYCTFAEAMERLSTKMEEKMKLEPNFEEQQDLYRPHIATLEQRCEEIKNTKDQPASEETKADAQQKAETALAKGASVLEDVGKRALHCGIGFRKRFVKKLTRLIAQQTSQVAELQSISICSEGLPGGS